jgi:CRISPR-associated exonuclease Cas4
MNDPWLIDVTDIKQYVCCPRLAYYRYCLPDIRPLTYAMEVGTESHKLEEDREIRRSLKSYGIEEGERHFRHHISAATLGLKGIIDLLIVVPSSQAQDKEAIIVEYKHSEMKAGPHFKLQIAAYALMIEEIWQIPVRRGFLYSIPLRKAEEIVITSALRKKVPTVVQAIKQLMDNEQMPEPTKAQMRCPTCEFRRFCNDVV